MLSDKLKSAQPIDFIMPMKNYIIKNYDENSYSGKVQKFLGEVQQNRNVISGLGEMKQDLDSLKSKRQIVLDYLNQLNILKSKMTFGNEPTSVKLDFQWRDTFKKINVRSVNIHFEFYNVMFNLAKIYFNIGKLESINAENDENRLKFSLNSFQYAAGLFEKMKDEIPDYIDEKEVPLDLKPNYMIFCYNVCIAYAQDIIIKISELKKHSIELLIQLYKGLEDIYKNVQHLAKDKTLCQYLGDLAICFINNRVNYSQALTYSKLRDQALNNFNKDGKNYGFVLVYQAELVECLQKNEKDLRKIKQLLPNDKLIYLQEQEKGAEIYNRNQNVYRHYTPNLNTLEKPLTKILANPAIPPEYSTNVEDSHELDTLISAEVREMINSYKTQMTDFINQTISQYENEDTVSQFLTSLGLPGSLEQVNSTGIDDDLWNTIRVIQVKGGAKYLQNRVTSLQRLSSEIQKRIEKNASLLAEEDVEDQKLRGQYGEQWERAPSTDLNSNYVTLINKYKGKLDVGKKCDLKTINDYKNRVKNFDLISLPRDKINQRIPNRNNNNNQMKQCKEVMDLKKEIDILQSEKNKAMNIINSMFQTLNYENIAEQFIQVIQHKTTEKAIFDKNKEYFTNMVMQLSEISDNIKNIEGQVRAKNDIFLQVKNNKAKPSPSNAKFFNDLAQYVRAFKIKDLQLQQGFTFYKKFNEKLTTLENNINDFINMRYTEKNNLISSLGNQPQQYDDEQNYGYDDNQQYDQGDQSNDNYYGQKHKQLTKARCSIFIISGIIMWIIGILKLINS